MRNGARSTGLVLCLLLALGGCSGDDDDGGGSSEGPAGEGRGASQSLKEAVAKTEAAGTARMTFEVSISNGESATIAGEGLVDFDHDRDLLTITLGGQTVQVFSDRGREYFRQGASGRYQRFPASADSPVANNPADSLKYLGTDVVGVKRADEDDCYEGSLDFKRIFARVERGHEAEFPEQLRGKKAPVTVCVDGAGRIRRYDVGLSIEGAGLEVRSTLSDHGRAPALDPLGPEERPR
jgi:hypothetical protein